MAKNSVALLGPPRRSSQGKTKIWNPPIMAITALNRMTGVHIGTVIFQNLCQALAPSTVAASYSERGTSCKVARKITIALPWAHMWTRISDGLANCGLERKGMIGTCKAWRVELIAPHCVLSKN